MVTGQGIIMKSLATILGLTVAAMVTTACASGSSDRYPPLAKRPFETAPAPATGQSGAPAPAVPPPAEPIRPVATETELARMVEDAVKSHAEFVARETVTARAVRAAAGQSDDSDARTRALVALADLISRRGATMATLADLDILAAAAATTLAPTDTIDAARARVLTLVETENAALARLWGEIGQ